jgi:hypothetical protein
MSIINTLKNYCICWFFIQLKKMRGPKCKILFVSLPISLWEQWWHASIHHSFLLFLWFIARFQKLYNAVHPVIIGPPWKLSMLLKSCWITGFYINFRKAYVATDTDLPPITFPHSLKIKLEVSIVVNISNEVLLDCDTFEVICCHNPLHCNINTCVVISVVYCDFTIL